MKRFLCVLACLLLICSSALADTAPRKLEEDEILYTSLSERAMEMAGLFNEALHNEDYLPMLQLPSGTEEELALLRMQDFTQPWSVTIVRADNALNIAQADQFSALLARQEASSPALAELLRQKLYASTGSILVASGGPSAIALSSALSFSDAFIRPEGMDGPCFAVMQYGGLYAFLVTFYPNVNQTVTAAAWFIPSRAADDLNLPQE